jgi:hypothetical protein
MPRHLPNELLALTFQHITSSAELSKLCTVSRAFRDEAQRILYHTVRLPNDRIISWCHTIVANPGLAMQVHALSLPDAFKPGIMLTVKPNLSLQELQQVVKRALSSLSRLVELEIHPSSGTPYVDSDMFCGHPFRLQVFGETLDYPCKLEHWLKFLSEQPGIRHWRPNIISGHPIDPDVLPLLTSAEVHFSALDILSLCPMIRALRVKRWSWGSSRELSRLKLFRRTLTSLSVGYFNGLLAVTIARDAVPNIKFLGLQLDSRVSLLLQSLLGFY